MNKPIVWSIAGSDSCAGAGIQADLKTFTDFNCHGCTITTLLSAQTIDKVHSILNICEDFFTTQLTTTYTSHPPQCIKIGIIPTLKMAQTLKEFLNQHKVPFVIMDPIISSSSEFCFTHCNLQKEILSLLAPYIDLITPNLHEAQLISDHADNPVNYFLDLGFKSVLLKGGHAKEPICSDLYADKNCAFYLNNYRLENKQVHGTGCCLSSAIAANVAKGYEIKDALVIAKMYMTQGIENAYEGFFNHLGMPAKNEYLPWVSHSAHKPFAPFRECKELGFYPIVDSFAWVKKLVKLNVKSIQLRIKDRTFGEIEQEIQNASVYAKTHNIKLFINDYWQLAIKHHCYGVHLGQEDIIDADLQSIHKAGLRLVISTHSFYEVAKALYYQPSYFAFGPVYPTTSKEMLFAPQGLNKLAYWRKVHKRPLIAIGGIHFNNLEDVMDTQVKSVAVISAVIQSPKLAKTVSGFLKTLRLTQTFKDEAHQM